MSKEDKDVCAKGHDYYLGTRRVPALLGLTYNDEDILYCRRCGDVRSISAPHPPSYQPYADWTYRPLANGITWTMLCSTSTGTSYDKKV